MMTIAELLRDEPLRQREFPVTRDQVFLAHAAVCPLPRRVVSAMADYLGRAQVGEQEAVVGRDLPHRVRQRAACLLQARPEEVALVGPTSLALSQVAGGLDWRAGDNVIVYHDDYPSNVYPWMALVEKGVEVRFLNAPALGQVTLESVRALVDERTRLVALASCHFITGRRTDLAGLGGYLKSQGVLFCLDAIQTLGAFPTTAEHVDFLAADAHKWLLGPCAAGILLVRQECQGLLRPTTFGWHNVRCPGFVAQDHLSLRPDAGRYEAGTANLIGLVGLQAAIDLLLELGIDQIATELLRKRAWLVPALQDKGYTVCEASSPPESASAIISFHRDKTDLAALHQELAGRQIITSLRTDRQGRHYLRISPHFYNTDEELGRLLERL